MKLTSAAERLWRLDVVCRDGCGHCCRAWLCLLLSLCSLVVSGPELQHWCNCGVRICAFGSVGVAVHLTCSVCPSTPVSVNLPAWCGSAAVPERVPQLPDCTACWPEQPGEPGGPGRQPQHRHAGAAPGPGPAQLHDAPRGQPHEAEAAANVSSRHHRPGCWAPVQQTTCLCLCMGSCSIGMCVSVLIRIACCGGHCVPVSNVGV